MGLQGSVSYATSLLERDSTQYMPYGLKIPYQRLPTQDIYRALHRFLRAAGPTSDILLLPLDGILSSIKRFCLRSSDLIIGTNRWYNIREVAAALQCPSDTSNDDIDAFWPLFHRPIRATQALDVVEFGHDNLSRCDHSVHCVAKWPSCCWCHGHCIHICLLGRVRIGVDTM